MSDNRVFGLQLRPITRVERMAIESFVSAGYDYTVYTYGDPKHLGAIPQPARYAPATDILPRDAFFRAPNGSTQDFELQFKFAALYEHGGLFVPTDYVLLRNLPSTPYLGVRHCAESPRIAWPIRAPANSWLARQTLQAICANTSIDDLQTLLSAIWPVKNSELLPEALAGPVRAETVIEQLLTPRGHLDAQVLGLSLHRLVWEDAEQARAPCTRFDATSLYERLWARYFGGSSDSDGTSLEALPEPNQERARPSRAALRVRSARTQVRESRRDLSDD